MVTVRPSLREVELRWSKDAKSSYVLLFGNQTISPEATEALWVSNTVTVTVVHLQEGTRYNYSLVATYGGVNSSTYKNYAVTSKTDSTHPHSSPPQCAITHIALLHKVISLW